MHHQLFMGFYSNSASDFILSCSGMARAQKISPSEPVSNPYISYHIMCLTPTLLEVKVSFFYYLLVSSVLAQANLVTKKYKESHGSGHDWCKWKSRFNVDARCPLSHYYVPCNSHHRSSNSIYLYVELKYFPTKLHYFESFVNHNHFSHLQLIINVAVRA